MQIFFSPDSRERGLARMRTIATVAAVLILTVFVLSSMYSAQHPVLPWVRAFAEAATVGAIADWFAVVALFRHPLGIPVLHTAIIPRNQDRIGRSLGQFVERNFLTPENVLRKLQQAALSRRLAGWLARPGGAQALSRQIGNAIPPMLAALEDEDMRRLLDRVLRPAVERLDVAAMVARVAEVLVEEDAHQELLDAALRSAQRWMEGNREWLTERFGEMSKYTPQFIDRYVVGRVIAGVDNVLQQVAADPQHELRGRFDAAVRRLVQELRESPERQQQVEAIKQALLRALAAPPQLSALWRAGKAAVLRDLRRQESAIRGRLAEDLRALGAALERDEGLRIKVDGWVAQAVDHVVSRNGQVIALFIEEIVRGWDARELTRKAELEIGRDLQYIRINGMVVGGLVGLALHALSKLW